jgi:hypothetical protein
MRNHINWRNISSDHTKPAQSKVTDFNDVVQVKPVTAQNLEVQHIYIIKFPAKNVKFHHNICFIIMYVLTYYLIKE